MKHKYIFKFSLIILLFAFTIFSKNVNSQCNPNEYQFNESLEGNTGVNMTYLLLSSFIDNLTYQSDNPYHSCIKFIRVVVGSSSVLDDNLN